MVTARARNCEDTQSFPYMSITRVPWAPLIELFIDLKLILVVFFALVDFERHILTTPGFLSGSVLSSSRSAWPNLPKIMSQPYCWSSPKTKFTNNLVFRTNHVTNITRIILSLLELLKPFLIKHLWRTDGFEAAGGKTYGMRRASKHPSNPIYRGGHDDDFCWSRGASKFPRSWLTAMTHHGPLKRLYSCYSVFFIFCTR